MRSIRKRDGRLERFDSTKIANAIGKAFTALGIVDDKAPAELAQRVTSVAEQRFSSQIPGVEDIQNLVEEVLIDAGYAEVAKAYILYRQRRSEIREAKRLQGIVDDLKLSVNATEVLRKRYLKRDERGQVARDSWRDVLPGGRACSQG